MATRFESAGNLSSSARQGSVGQPALAGRSGLRSGSQRQGLAGLPRYSPRPTKYAERPSSWLQFAVGFAFGKKRSNGCAVLDFGCASPKARIRSSLNAHCTRSRHRRLSFTKAGTRTPGDGQEPHGARLTGNRNLRPHACIWVSESAAINTDALIGPTGPKDPSDGTACRARKGKNARLQVHATVSVWS